MADRSEDSPLIPPTPITDPSDEIDLEAGPTEQTQCRICLDTDGNFTFLSISKQLYAQNVILSWPYNSFLFSGRDFIAPCKCNGTSKYVHRHCLDHWRAVKVTFLSQML